jgi:hypothetical protein
MAVWMGAVTQWDRKALKNNAKRDGCCMAVWMGAVTQRDRKALLKTTSNTMGAAWLWVWVL